MAKDREEENLRRMLKTPPKPHKESRKREVPEETSRRRSSHQDVKDSGNTKKA
jgi:hypothetical protein